MNTLIGNNLLELLDKLYEEEGTEYVKMLRAYVVQYLILLGINEAGS